MIRIFCRSFLQATSQPIMQPINLSIRKSTYLLLLVLISIMLLLLEV